MIHLMSMVSWECWWAAGSGYCVVLTHCWFSVLFSLTPSAFCCFPHLLPHCCSQKCPCIDSSPIFSTIIAPIPSSLWLLMFSSASFYFQLTSHPFPIPSFGPAPSFPSISSLSVLTFHHLKPDMFCDPLPAFGTCTAESKDETSFHCQLEPGCARNPQMQRDLTAPAAGDTDRVTRWFGLDLKDHGAETPFPRNMGRLSPLSRSSGSMDHECLMKSPSKALCKAGDTGRSLQRFPI